MPNRATAWAIGSAVIAVLLLSLAVFVLLPALRAAVKPVGDLPILAPPPPEVDPGAIVELLPRGSIQTIDDPQFESAEAAEAFMNPDERVIGVLINGDARAYPINVLSVHEVVNDVVGGEPVAVTWCPLCFSALVFSRRAEGAAFSRRVGEETLTFRPEPVDQRFLIDEESGSRWQATTGTAVDGHFKDTELTAIIVTSTFAFGWYDYFPDSGTYLPDSGQ
jgi:hypothetical protein